MTKMLVKAGTALAGIGAIVATLFLAGIIEAPRSIAPEPSSYCANLGGGLKVNYGIGERGNVTVEEIHTEKPIKIVQKLVDGKPTGKMFLAEDIIVVGRTVKKYKRRPASLVRPRVLQ